MLAVFGIPGGGEFWVIVAIASLAFGPSAIVAWVAYRLGISRGRERAEEAGRAEAESGAEAPQAPEAPEAPVKSTDETDKDQDV